MKVISWNMQRKHESWHCLLDMADIDLALLQEAGKPPSDAKERIEADPAIELDPARWETMDVGGNSRYRTAIVKLSNRIAIDWIESRFLCTAKSRELVASRLGTFTAACVTPPSGAPVVAVSMYAQLVRTHTQAGKDELVSDGSAHRIISDLSTFIAKKDGHRVLVAGDMNLLRDHSEYGSYWAARHKTVFDRMEAMGLPCIGPEYPNGRKADPWPDELPRDSRNVPTYYSKQNRPRESPETAKLQYDYVFASTQLADSLKVRALNEPAEWGPSDHCRVEIELAQGA